jgi:hypothetical protein
MKNTRWLGIGPFVFALLIAGCSGTSTQRSTVAKTPAAQKEDNADIKADIHADLGKLSAEDQKLAEEQRFCAVENEHQLGSMGVPVKIMVNDQPVFLCCKRCEKRALADPDKTLAKVKELKAKAAATPIK